jgi:hypothetical protein
MSSSFRSRAALRRAIAVGLVAAVSTAAVPDARAAQTYFVPRVEVGVEYNDNFGLTPSASPNTGVDAYGFIADAEALIGIATPRGDTTVRPRIRAQEYPDIDDEVTLGEQVTPIEAFLDVVSTYKWQRADLDVNARYARQDSYNVETASGAFDPIDPDQPANPDSARTRVGETRDSFEFEPSFRYALTERLGLGARLDYLAVRYDAEDGVTSDLDYDNALVDGFLNWELSRLSDVTVGVLASRYETEDDISTTDSVGGHVAYQYRWSESTGVRGEVFYRSSDVTHTVPIHSEDSNSGWGGTLTAYRKLEVSRWRVTIGRRYIPTSAGSNANLDQLRLQYTRDLSQRLQFGGVARYESRQDTDREVSRENRDYARGDLSLTWNATRNWYVTGSYSYIWEDRERAISDADNNRFYVGVGYRGLRPQ